MTESLLAQEALEKLESSEVLPVEQSLAEDSLASKPTYFIGPSSVTDEAIVELLDNGWFPASRASPSPTGETTPNPLEGYALVFCDYFSCGLRFPCGSLIPWYRSEGL